MCHDENSFWGRGENGGCLGIRCAGAAAARRTAWLSIAIGVFALLAPSGGPLPAPESSQAATLALGFQETTVFSGLTNPTVVRFASDGRVFVAEKSGLIKVFDSLSDTTPTVVRRPARRTSTTSGTGACSGWRSIRTSRRRPTCTCSTPTTTCSAAPRPRWGTAGGDSDAARTRPGATTDGCVVSGRLSRLAGGRQRDDGLRAGARRGLVPAVSRATRSGRVEFGPDGALYASAGDGASFNFVDYGQDGNPLNPCGDPPGGVGAVLTPPTAEGGALRSQDLRTSGDPVALDGSIIRVDPATGRGAPLQSARRQLRSERPADHRLRPAQSLPLHLPSGDERALDRRRGLERLGGDQPHPRPDRRRRSRTSAGPATRATRARRATTRPTSRSARTCTATRAPTRSPTSPTTTRTRSSPARRVPTGSSSVSGLSLRVRAASVAATRPSIRARSSSPTTRATASG